MIPTCELGEALYTRIDADFFMTLKVMALRESNPVVHMNKMRSINQGESELIHNYVAQLREAAIDCDVKDEQMSCVLKKSGCSVPL